jgi:hypothetical protein
MLLAWRHALHSKVRFSIAGPFIGTILIRESAHRNS